MKVIWIAAVILLLISASLFAKEVRTEKSTGKDGEPIVTTYYEGESDGMTKRIQYGTGPKYRLEERDFPADAKNYVAKTEYYNMDYGQPKYPNGRPDRRVTTYRDDRPDFIYQVADYRIDKYSIRELKYRPENPNSIDHSVRALLENGQIYSDQIYCLDNAANTEHVSIIKHVYLAGQQIGTENTYFPTRADHVVEMDDLFYQEDVGKPNPRTWKRTKTYQDSPQGYLRVESGYRDDGSFFVRTFFDKTKSKNGIEKIEDLWVNNKLTNEATYYGILLNGKIAYKLTETAADGTISSQFFDASGQQVAP
jgi:hypothetical protein